MEENLIKCESCSMSDNCRILDSKKCHNFAKSIDSNYRYVFDPELLQSEKQSFA